MDSEHEPVPDGWLELMVGIEIGCRPDDVRGMWVNDVMDVLDRMHVEGRIQMKRGKELERARL